jgi:hypothetical protein
MEIVVVYLIIGALAAYALYLTSRGRNLGIIEPTIGFLNVGGDSFVPLVEQDRTALGPLFSKIEMATGYQIPKRNVLFIYADIASDGSVGLGSNVTIRHLWTIDRKGEAFSRFFKEMFTRMKAGTSMPKAWNAIAPQYRHAVHHDLPVTICQLEAGQVRFR